MISYRLSCAAGHGFEGWFRNSRAFDDQAAAGSLVCPVCGSDAVAKAMMAPAIGRSGRGEPAPSPAPAAPPTAEGDPKTPAPAAAGSAPATEPGGGHHEASRRTAALLHLARKLHDHVTTKFENVGRDFARTARRIDAGEEPARDIYGQASAEEVKGLEEDGIRVGVLPVPPKGDA